jgi:uncharacterized membrane protein YeaQ/YmgE (transglycosylase-associated protein family)
MPDIVSLVIWLIAGAAVGMAINELLMGDYGLGPGGLFTGAIGGIVGAEILLILMPALGGFDIRPVLGQITGAAVGGAVLTVLTGVFNRWRQERR